MRRRSERMRDSAPVGVIDDAAWTPSAAVYLGLAYAAKLAFGVSLTFTAMR